MFETEGGVRQLTTQGCLHRLRRSQTHSVNLSVGKAACCVRDVEGWPGMDLSSLMNVVMKVLQMLYRKWLPECRFNYALFFSIYNDLCHLCMCLNLKWNLPEEVSFWCCSVSGSSNVFRASRLLLLQDASVEPQTVEAVKMLPETSAVWSNERFYLYRLAHESENRNNVTITVEVINFQTGSGLEELWLCCLLLPLLFYPVNFVFLSINATHRYCTNLVYGFLFFCFGAFMTETLKHALKLQKEAASFHSAFQQLETTLVTQNDSEANRNLPSVVQTFLLSLNVGLGWLASI